MTHARNERLAALLDEAGWSRAQAATAFNRVATENGYVGQTGVGRSHVSMWVGGTKPSGSAPIILCQALSRRLNRIITPGDLGFSSPPSVRGDANWLADPLDSLAELGGSEVDPDRTAVLSGAVYSVASLTLPGEGWWRRLAQRPDVTPDRRRGLVGPDDVATVQDLTLAFSKVDQRRGGGHGRRALVRYLSTEVDDFLRSRFTSEAVRTGMFSAAGELAYLSGWMAFDNSEHAIAQRYFVLALKLAATADDPPLAGHILRAMAHQAIDLGHYPQGLELAEASVAGPRYGSATPRERALLGVVHARSLAANGRTRDAAKALVRAEDDLNLAGYNIPEPQRTFFFGEASLAHETALTLGICNDRAGAIREFERSVRARGSAFRRTHAVTLGYLGSVQIADGRVEEACITWNTALDTMEGGVHSGRARQIVVDLRRHLTPFRRRGIEAVAALDNRAAVHLARVD